MWFIIMFLIDTKIEALEKRVWIMATHFEPKTKALDHICNKKPIHYVIGLIKINLKKQGLFPSFVSPSHWFPCWNSSAKNEFALQKASLLMNNEWGNDVHLNYKGIKHDFVRDVEVNRPPTTNGVTKTFLWVNLIAPWLGEVFKCLEEKVSVVVWQWSSPTKSHLILKGS